MFTREELKLIKNILKDRVKLGEILVKDSERQGFYDNVKTVNAIESLKNIIAKIENYESEMD